MRFKTIDEHVHVNINDPEKIRELAEVCRASNTQAVLLGGRDYGGKEYVPNEQVAEIVAQYPDAFLFGAKIDLGETAPDPGLVDKYVRMGAVQLKFIYPYFAYDDDRYMPVYERAEQYRIPCLFHTGNYAQHPKDRIIRRPMIRNMQPLTLDRVARSFQNLPIIIAHLGTTFFRLEAAEMVKHFKNVYFDLAGDGSWGTLSAEDMLKLMSFTIPLHDVRLTGFQRMVIGSDAYVTHKHLIPKSQEYYKLMFEKVGIPEDLEHRICHGNMESLFAAIRRPE